MTPFDTDTALVDGYYKLLANLSAADKLDLISKLTQSVKTDLTAKEQRFYNAFGAWSSDESAESLIEVIKFSKTSSNELSKPVGM